jgi:hypothetical protein
VSKGREGTEGIGESIQPGGPGRRYNDFDTTLTTSDDFERKIHS